MFFSVLSFLCLCACLFICALRSPAGKGLTSWLLFVMSNCEVVTFPSGVVLDCTDLFLTLIFHVNRLLERSSLIFPHARQT